MNEVHKICILTIFSFLCPVLVYMSDMGNSTMDNYGPYKLDLTSYHLCKGPKKKDVTLFDLVVKYNGDNNCVGTFNFTFLEPARIDNIRLTVYSVVSNQKKVLYRYSIQKPCQHFIIADTINRQLNATNCLVQKGKYVYTLNFDEYVSTFWGKSFFYGTYEVKEVVMSKNANIMCAVMIAKILKKDN